MTLIHPHVLRHVANDGHDTQALQHYLGHKNIQHTVRYTEMAPDRAIGPGGPVMIEVAVAVAVALT
jgi:integrase